MNSSDFDLTSPEKLSAQVATWHKEAKDCEVVAYVEEANSVRLYWLRREVAHDDAERTAYPAHATRLAVPGASVEFAISPCFIERGEPRSSAETAKGGEEVVRFGRRIPCDPPSGEGRRVLSLIVFSSGPLPDSTDLTTLGRDVLVLKTYEGSSSGPFRREYLATRDISAQGRRFKRSNSTESPVIFHALAIYVPAYAVRPATGVEFPGYVYGVDYRTTNASSAVFLPLKQVIWVE